MKVPHWIVPALVVTLALAGLGGAELFAIPSLELDLQQAEPGAYSPGRTVLFLVDGVRCATVGRVSMDMLAVDLSALPDAGIGCRVTLWGRGPGGAVLPIDEVARAAGTIGYELMCALAARVPVQAVP